MSEILKPTVKEIELTLIEASKGQAKQGWLGKILSGFRTVLNENRLRYRGFGPYWWVLKKAMIDSGIADFGDHIDKQWFDIADYGKTEFNVIAAYLYEDAKFDMGLMFDPVHILPAKDDETIEYVSYDDDMEGGTETNG